MTALQIACPRDESTPCQPEVMSSVSPSCASIRARLSLCKEIRTMEYVKLGSTGLDVSRLCLGCMTYGVPDRGTHPWTLDEEKSRPLIKAALEAGINFFDTANTYSDGTSEEIVGRALRDFTKRDDIVIASKVFNRMRPGPN